MDFSELDRREPISKFGFAYLGLLEMTDDDDDEADGGESKKLVTVYLPDGNLTMLELESRHIPLRTLMELAFAKYARKTPHY